MLEAADSQQAGKSTAFLEPADFRRREWAGAACDSSGELLSVNLQDPGTFALTGPWQGGTL
jgi:uncharacterized protein